MRGRAGPGSPEHEPAAAGRGLVVEIEQEPGRYGAEKRRAVQVEHERGVAAEQRDELGLELLTGAGLEVRPKE